MRWNLYSQYIYVRTYSPAKPTSPITPRAPNVPGLPTEKNEQIILSIYFFRLYNFTWISRKANLTWITFLSWKT